MVVRARVTVTALMLRAMVKAMVVMVTVWVI